MPHLPAHFCTIGNQLGRCECFSMSRSNVFLRRFSTGGAASDGATVPAATAGGAALSPRATSAAFSPPTFSSAGWTIWKSGSIVPAVNMPQTMPTASRNQ